MRETPDNLGIKNVDSYFEYLWGKDTQTKTQLIIIDTSELSIDVLETLTSVLSRLIFSQRKEFSVLFAHLTVKTQSALA